MTGADTALEIRDLTIRFGGVTALDGVSFEVAVGEVLGVLGPNGAGKTTLLDCLNGLHAVSGGTIGLCGQDVTSASPSRRARLGLARTFQNVALFGSLDVIDNLLVGRHNRMRAGMVGAALWFGRCRREEIEQRNHCQMLAERLGLRSHLGVPVDSLPTSVQRRVELGRALACEPSVLLLDEPVAGMGPDEAESMSSLLHDVVAETGLTAVVVEHNLGVLRALADRLVALDFGRVVAVGEASEVLGDGRVASSYLGSDR